MSDQNEYKENHKNDSRNNRGNGCHRLPITAANAFNFPAKLHFMLNELQRDGLEYIASWQPHGRCFLVRNPKEFENNILPCYFQQSKITSFQRQLSFYGFRRIVLGQDKGGYFHEHFLRGKEELAIKVRRTKIKGTGPRRPNSMESPTPNFYEMAFLPDNNNSKNSNHDSEKTEDASKAAKETYDYTPRISLTDTFEAKISEDIASSSPRRKDDVDKSMTWTRNQDRLHQLQQLNEIDRDLLLLSTASRAIKNHLQAQESCQANLNRICSSSLSDILCNTPMWKASIGPSQSSFLGLNCPLALSSRKVPLLSYHRTSTTLPTGGVTPFSLNSSDMMIRDALAKYFQQR